GAVGGRPVSDPDVCRTALRACPGAVAPVLAAVCGQGDCRLGEAERAPGPSGAVVLVRTRGAVAFHGLVRPLVPGTRRVRRARMTVSLDLARELLDMGAMLRGPGDGPGPHPQAEEQLKGVVAIHNILQREGVAYLADEVGMGKTYVALGAIALARHFNPDLRVAVIAPRENIQEKWIKDWTNFAQH